MSSSALQLNGVTSGYKTSVVLRGTRLTVARGESVARNGPA